MSAQNPKKPAINVLWLKRDLRLVDHEPLLCASQHDLPLLVIYVFEPELINDKHYSTRHWRFIWQSLQALNAQLSKYQTSIHISTHAVINTLEYIHKHHAISNLFSHEEVGIDLTFQRDKVVKSWCDAHQIKWQEFQNGSVIRGLKSRQHWDKAWNQYMRSEIKPIDLAGIRWVQLADRLDPEYPKRWQHNDPEFQTGGSTHAQDTLNSFFTERGQKYHMLISKPEASRHSCSRMSPYLAWGNISLRSMYQQLLGHWNKPYWRRALAGLSSRLHWHCHFIQKFESESRMEFEALNRGYKAITYRDGPAAKADLDRWKQGQTGFPLVDACMRCLHQTGYINFRMRAMLVSFLCHNLRLDWRDGVEHLASLFLDFEPGIHYAQFQMQAGLMGVNTVRIYNVVKQSKDHDPEGTFIKKWLPELSNIPAVQIHEPWLLTAMEQQFYAFDLKRDYHEPCVDIQASAKESRTLLYGWRKKAPVQAEIKRILATHVRPR
ncbi:deoxyribodipyrimidine photo-lyase [Marinicella sp. S1101]|uniref:cryptochrome/deoxyribodipyrimidine photo-lyase family protein n=1 Tax=Marinicella marina TaxID=2996016 RepID=UPI002260B27E|nr:deoxyribodipyrimidine photo-lyase [Marinicella marina]MCX7554586.1 deoxyribodipyrimidine photo-lyase [Marinicella marina]MDJ1141030.1 deoxyribodipyrimidine photo-lyase [Marinicella marina]